MPFQPVHGARAFSSFGRHIQDIISTYEVVERDIGEIARRELGESGGGKYVEKETWWWDPQVQEAVKAKKEAFKNWRTTRNEADK